MAGFEANQKDQFRRNPRRVYSEASSATKGYGATYNLNTGTAATLTATRHKLIEAPSAANFRFFAGVHQKTLTRAQMTDISEPGKGGSVAQCYIGAAVTILDRVWMDVETGKFYEGGIGVGRGSGVVLQTLTAAGLADVLLDDGGDDTFVQLLTPIAAGGAIVCSQAGMTLIDGTTINDANATFTLADGLYVGQKKGFKITGTVGNSKVVLITVTNGVQADLATNLATISLNTAAEECVLEWLGTEWVVQYYVGATLSS